MSKTMFWYIMRDLLRIFLMTSVVLAAIMSFGGLLKPLMQFGLTGTQVGRMLIYFLPATQTYSLPIAALFATTMVYGRLSADNELTACRATGMSYLTLAVPAFVLGLVLAIISLLSLSFVVPRYTLKVEKVAFASLADVVQKNIQRSHQIKLPGYTIYADAAYIQPPLPDAPNDERVVLINPLFCDYDQLIEPDGARHVPSDFYTATSAEVRIRKVGDDVECYASLTGGAKFPRIAEHAAVGGLHAAEFGPFSLPSPIKENTKFMTIKQLKELDRNPLRSREIRKYYMQILRQEQEYEYLRQVLEGLKTDGYFRFEGADDEIYTLAVQENTRRLLLSGRTRLAAARGRDKVVISSAGDGRDVWLIHQRAGSPPTRDEARAITVRAQVDLQTSRVVHLRFELTQASVDAGEASLMRETLARPFKVAAPADIQVMDTYAPEQLLQERKLRTLASSDLRRRLTKLHNSVGAELHGRASFAVSGLILVTIGCALGMIFRTGNFLNAFALSVIPALLCIALVVTGQHLAESGKNSLDMGLGIIWSGNFVVLILSVGLLGYLQRQ